MCKSDITQFKFFWYRRTCLTYNDIDDVNVKFICEENLWSATRKCECFCGCSMLCGECLSNKFSMLFEEDENQVKKCWLRCLLTFIYYWYFLFVTSYLRECPAKYFCMNLLHFRKKLFELSSLFLLRCQVLFLSMLQF